MLLNSFQKLLEKKELFQTVGFLQFVSIYCFLAQTGEVHLGDLGEILPGAVWSGSACEKLPQGAKWHHLLTTTAKN